MGFPDLKNLFRDHLKQKKNYYSSQVKTSLLNGYTDSDQPHSTLEHVIQDEWSNVMLMADTFGEKMFSNTIRLLASETENYLITSAQGDYFFSPVAAAIIYIETILSELIKMLGHSSIQRLDHTEMILEKLKIEM